VQVKSSCIKNESNMNNTGIWNHTKKIFQGNFLEGFSVFIFKAMFRKHKTLSEMQGYVHLVGKGICKF